MWARRVVPRLVVGALIYHHHTLFGPEKSRVVVPSHGLQLVPVSSASLVNGFQQDQRRMFRIK
ncbi:hypothetical protein Mapa_005649 [Marchantia paleacea]|nr:hypothetical protein Mapa_005649 [Marchantia paleacea]